MLTIDGTYGEGGGQILRTSLALAIVTGQPVTLVNIRAGREKPGLMRQHVTAVNAAAEISRATVKGNDVGASRLVFEPRAVHPGSYTFAIGTAGSCTLVLQTLLPALLTAGAATELVIEGGTHNPLAPPFDFLHDAFLPLLERMGARVTARLVRPGFYPAGGGKLQVTIEPAAKLKPLELLSRGATSRREGIALLSRLPLDIGQRELKVLREKLGLTEAECRVEPITNSPGPGNVLLVKLHSEAVTEVFTGFGARGKPAELVASELAALVRTYLAADVPVGSYLADQLLLPLALAGGGAFRTLPLSSHALTNLHIIRQFLPLTADVTPDTPHSVCVRVQQGR